MATDSEGRIVYCPSCFRRGLEQRLLLDPRDGEWYCRKCLFTGSREEALEQRRQFIRNEYPLYDQ